MVPDLSELRHKAGLGGAEAGGANLEGRFASAAAGGADGNAQQQVVVAAAAAPAAVAAGGGEEEGEEADSTELEVQRERRRLLAEIKVCGGVGLGGGVL